VSVTTARRAPDPTSWITLAIFGILVLAVAITGSVAATSSSNTYKTLELPPFAPPSWVFSPVWTVIYITIAISGWRAYLAGASTASLALYALGLVLNASWTPLFFAFEQYELALADIIALDLVVAGTIVLFWARSVFAGALQLPYLAWILFATALNAAIVTLNERSARGIATRPRRRGAVPSRARDAPHPTMTPS